MSVRAVQNSDTLNVGNQWVIAVAVRDLDGCYTDAVTPVVTITLPDASTVTPTLERADTGLYRTTHTVAAAGRYICSAVAAGYGSADLALNVSAVTTGTGVPSVDEYKNYVKQDFGSWDDEEIEATLLSEASAQRAVCRVGAVIPPDLREAVMRRVRVNLSRRNLPVLVTVDSEGNNTFLPTNDPEVRRLERPYRKVVTA